jgi:hypothetical protein
LIHRWQVPGYQNVYYTIIDSFGCQGTDTLVMNVLAPQSMQEQIR